VTILLAFEPLLQELERWRVDGRVATFWWRDDDACSDSPALARLFALASRHRVPVAIAAIPAGVDRSLVAAIGRCEHAHVVQHGYAHRNHAPPGARSAELGDDRTREVTLAELAVGRRILEGAVGERFSAILVPPWNRVAEALLPCLRDAGYAGVSRFGPRVSAGAEGGLAEVNTHVDPIAWRRGRAFIGCEAGVARIVAHLQARRAGTCDAGEPTGLLTHHLAFDDDAFAFVDGVLGTIARHDAARWLDVRTAFDAELTCARCA
jgi:hypothetical protein